MPKMIFANQHRERAGTIFRSRLCSEVMGKARQEQHRLSLRTLVYSFGLLWFLSGLLALQSALISANNQSDASYQTAALLQDRQTFQPSDPAGRSQNSSLTAPVRAILTPALYFSSKALPFGGNGTFIITALFTVLAVFSALRFAFIQRNPALLPDNIAIRARAPPVSSFI